MTEVFGQQSPSSPASDYSSAVFLVQQLIAELAGPTLVEVVSCTNTGGTIPAGFVNVQPLVNQMTGNQQPQPHGVVNNLPYFRLQAGGNAIIMDPQPGDIGLACFASRDISAVKVSNAQANPPSRRMWDWADGIYLGGVIGTAEPTQRVQFTAQGVTVVSPQQITLTAPQVTINASTGVNVTTPLAAFSEDVSVANDMSVEGTTSGSGAAVITGDLTVTGTTTGSGDGVFAGVSVSTHVHPGVESGSSDTGPPT